MDVSFRVFRIWTYFQIPTCFPYRRLAQRSGLSADKNIHFLCISPALFCRVPSWYHHSSFLSINAFCATTTPSFMNCIDQRIITCSASAWRVSMVKPLTIHSLHYVPWVSISTDRALITPHPEGIGLYPLYHALPSRGISPFNSKLFSALLEGNVQLRLHSLSGDDCFHLPLHRYWDASSHVNSK